MTAWLGTALKSSQPSRNAVCRSDRPMVRTIGAAAISGAVGPRGVALPGDDVAISLLPSGTAGFRAPGGAQAAVCGNDHDQARREDRKPKLAMSRTESQAYSQSMTP